METAYLKTLLEVAATGSFSKAADKLFVTQSTVSRRIQFLEDHYCFPLLDRSEAVIKPTAVGNIVIEKAYRVLEIENDLVEELKSHRMDKGISFGCTPAFGISYLPTIIRKFMLENTDTGNLEFHFDTPDRVVEGIREKCYDLAAIEHCNSLDFNGLQIIALPDDEMVFVSSPKLGISSSHAGIGTIAENRLYSRDSNCCSYKFLNENMKSVGRTIDDFKSPVIMDDLQLIIKSVLNGDGITYVPKSLVIGYLDEGNLLSHKVEGFLLNRKRSLLWKNNDDGRPTVRRFKECVLSLFRETSVFEAMEPGVEIP